MNTAEVHIPQKDMRKLLATASADAALLYLYLQGGNAPDMAAEKLNISQSRVSCALATLRQLDLYGQEKSLVAPMQRPTYTEQDILCAMDTDRDFRALYGEIQRLLGRPLNTEEMKIILGFIRYLGLAPDVVCVLVSYCKDRNRQRGNHRNPSLRTIEKEAYAWAEQGIDTMEEAAAFIQRQNVRTSQLGQLMKVLQIYGRKLTAGEEKYANAWLEMGFSMDAFRLAYERTCLNTGNMAWAYMNTILTRWHEAGLHTAEQVKNQDKKPVPKGASGQLGQAELAAIQKLMQEG
ncbi:MAG: DnaD domain protein [Oscillospiraceae bacterium]|nr:DnaD domain protein [Oscillospiraceae bacterium]